MTLDQILLLGSIIVPALSSALLFAGIGGGDYWAKKLAYIGFGFPFIAGIVLFFNFDGSNGGYCFEIFHPRMGLQELKITFHLGLNGVSSPLFAMAGVVGLAAGLTAIRSGAERLRLYLALLLVMQSGLMGLFASIDLFFYYLFHEFALIPTFIMIGLWGGRDRRSIALEITIYLTLGALLSLGGLVALNVMVDAEKFDFPSLSLALANAEMLESTQIKIFGLLLIGFGILVALFPFHTWSPDGHASAPTAVSMLHAGVLMKLGGYGVFRVALFLLPAGAMHWDWFFIILAATGVIYGAFGALKQTDLKYINAYSSVSHLGMVLFALLMLNKTAWNGAILQSLSHGFMTALFFALIGIIYSRTHTRDIYKLGGLLKTIPFISAMYVIAGLASLGLPGFSGFVAEMNIFVGAFQHEELFYRIATIVSVSAIVVTAVYILRVVGIMLMGQVKNKEYLELQDATWYETTGILLSKSAVLKCSSISLAPFNNSL